MLVPTLFRHNLAPGRTGVYLSTARGLGGGPEILFYSFKDQTTKTVLRLPRAVGLGISLAPDESWLVFSQIDGSGADLMLVNGFSLAADVAVKSPGQLSRASRPAVISAEARR